MIGRRTSFWLGFSAALGLLLTVAMVALAGRSSSGSPAVTKNDSPDRGPLAVFSKKRGPADVLPARLAASLGDLAGDASVPAALRNGTPQLEKSRLLLSNVGSTHADLYAFPTSKGYVCQAFDAGPRGCSRSFTRELPVGLTRFDVDGLGTGTPMAIAGLVPNNITRVDVVVEGTAHAALLRNNAYFFEAPNAAAQPEAVRVHFASGNTTTIPLAQITTPSSG